MLPKAPLHMQQAQFLWLRCASDCILCQLALTHISSRKQSAVYAYQHVPSCPFAGAASNVVHPEPYRARRDALLGPEHTSSPSYRRAAVTSSPRNMPLTALQALHPRVAQLQRQESGSSLGSGASQSPLHGSSGSPVRSDNSAGNLQLLNGQAGLEQRQWRRVST